LRPLSFWLKIQFFVVGLSVVATRQPKASLCADPVPFNCRSQPNETRQATPSSTVTQTATVDAAGTNLPQQNG